MRYLIPVFPVLALVVSYIFTYYQKRKIVFTVLCFIVGGCVGFNLYHIIKDFQAVAPLAVVTGQEPKETFLRRLIPVYEMYETANTILPEDAYVFLIYMKNYGYLCDRRHYADAMFETYTLQKVLAGSMAPGYVSDDLKKRGFTHIMYDDIFVTGEMSPLTMEEKSRFASFRACCAETLAVEDGRYHLCRLK
jgi:hypothetical protein